MSYPKKSKLIPINEIIDMAERKGMSFEASGIFDIAASGTNKTIAINGSRPSIFFSRELSYNGSGVIASIFRDPTFTAGSSFVDRYNSNDINPQLPEMTFNGDATITDDGILTRSPRYVFGNESNQGGGSALQAIDSPQLIPPFAVFMFDLTNRDTGTQTVASHVRWVEVDFIDGLIIQDGQFVAYNGV